MIDSLSDKDLLQQFSSKSLEALENNTASIEDKVTSRKIESCHPILEIMKQRDDFAQICPFNTKRERGNILNQLENWKTKPHNLNYLDELFIICMAFSREYLLYQERNSIGPHLKINHYWREFKTDVEQQIYPIEQYLKGDAQYVRNDMELSILNSHLNPKGYQAFLDYEKTVEEAEHKILKLKSDLNDTEELFKSEIIQREKKLMILKAF